VNGPCRRSFEVGGRAGLQEIAQSFTPAFQTLSPKPLHQSDSTNDADFSRTDPLSQAANFNIGYVADW
jgi:hypothetical protein